MTALLNFFVRDYTIGRHKKQVGDPSLGKKKGSKKIANAKYRCAVNSELRMTLVENSCYVSPGAMGVRTQVYWRVAI